MQLQWIFCSREWTLRYYNKLTQRLLRCQFMPELRKEESHSVTRNRTQSSMWPRFTITSSHMTNQVWSLHVSNLGKFLTKHHSPELMWFLQDALLYQAHHPNTTSTESKGVDHSALCLSFQGTQKCFCANCHLWCRDKCVLCLKQYQPREPELSCFIKRTEQIKA